MANRYSIVHWYPELEKHKCGYCKQLTSNCSHGMWTESLTVEDYQNLIDRGWRRSGKYCYKSVMDQTCCPLYTIKCEALNVKLSKSQKKILKRVNKFLSEADYEKHHDTNDMHFDEISTDVITKEKPNMTIDVNQIEITKFHSPVSKTNESTSKTNDLSPSKILKKESSTSITQGVSNNNDTGNKMDESLDTRNIKTGYGADPSKPPCKKAKLIRLERRQQKLASKGILEEQKTNQNQGKSLEDFITDLPENPIHRLRICLVETGGSKDWQITRSQEYPIYKKYQMLVHNDPPEKCSEKQFGNFLFESPLEIELVKMSSNEPTFTLTAKLYEKYQVFVHDDALDECDVNTYEEFLVVSPLQHWSPPDGPPCGYGSFHQQYWLDDKLIAVGVIDILPRCLSSVYFFYDPDYRHLTLGTYGSLREVEFTRKLNRDVPELKYYYMGFYIHSCPKMRYKANLSPSYLLCPETYEWFSIEKCIPKLELSPYSRLNDDLDALDSNSCDPSDIDSILILIKYRKCVPYRYIKEKVNLNEDELKLFANLVGKKCVSELIVILRGLSFY